MNIGMVCYPTFGGSGIVAAELGKELSRRGHNIHFMSYDVPARIFPPGKRIFFHEVKVFAYPLFQYPPYSLALATKIAEVAEYEKLDLVHVHYAIPHAISALHGRNTGDLLDAMLGLLPDDVYGIHVDGSVTNVQGDAFNGGVDAAFGFSI